MDRYFSFVYSGKLKKVILGALRLTLPLSLAALLIGCSNYNGFLTGPPSKLYDDETVLTAPGSLLDISNLASISKPGPVSPDDRNNFVSMRMYAIDIQYSKYESSLTTRAEDTNLGASVIQLGLTGAASVAPVAQTGKILSAIATGVNGASAAVDKDVLLSQTIQNLETQMRTDRNNQAAKIIASMKCNITDYPLGLALSDLEDYYRAGTLASALVGVSKTVGSAEFLSKANKDAASPSDVVSEQGQITAQSMGRAAAASANDVVKRCT